MEGDFVSCDISDRDRVHPSKIAHAVPVLARIDKLECALASEQRVGQGRLGSQNIGSVRAHVTVFDLTYEKDEEVFASAAGYKDKWWPATIVNVDDDGVYTVKWHDEVKDSRTGALQPQTDLRKSARDLKKKNKGPRFVADTSETKVVDAKQIMSRAFVFHSSVVEAGSTLQNPSGAQEYPQIPNEVFAKSVYFCNDDSFEKVLSAHFDILFTHTEIVRSADSVKKWYDHFLVDSHVLHRRITFNITPSGRPKYMELLLRDGSDSKVWQVSKCHYNRSSVINTQPCARHQEFQPLLKFRDESGAPCKGTDQSLVRCSWQIKSEHGSHLALDDDGSLPMLKLTRSTEVEVEVVVNGQKRPQTLKLAHLVKIQHGDPAKINLKVIDERRQVTDTVNVGQTQNYSLSITVLDAFDEPIPISDQYNLNIAKVYTQDASGSKHPVTARIEDHGRGEQRWMDVNHGSGHALERDIDDNAFILPKCCFGGKVGQVQLVIEALVLDSTSDESIELRSDDSRLHLNHGPASKIQLIHNTFADTHLSTIYLNSHVSETNTIKVAATDYFGNRVDCQHLSVTLCLPDGKTVESQREPDQKLYGLTFTAGPYHPGEYHLQVSGRSKVSLDSLHVRVSVKPSNRVEKIDLRLVEMSKSPGDKFLKVEAEFHTEDKIVLPEHCRANCQLLWVANGKTLQEIELKSCQGVNWEYGHRLTLQVPLSEIALKHRQPAVYELCVQYSEKRSGLKDDTKQSDPRVVELSPGLCLSHCVVLCDTAIL